MITGIKWVSELIEIAGATDVFSALAVNESATDRVVTSKEVIEAAPDIIIASWCGKKVRPETFGEREGWSIIPAVQQNRIFEVKSPLILQPGPAALTDGLNKLVQILSSLIMANPRTNQVYGKTSGFQSGAIPKHTPMAERSTTTFD